MCEPVGSKRAQKTSPEWPESCQLPVNLHCVVAESCLTTQFHHRCLQTSCPVALFDRKDQRLRFRVRSFSCKSHNIMFHARRLTPCMRAPLLEPLIVASSLPFASGLARFTSCELPKEAGLFSPDISQTQSKLCSCCLALVNSSFCRMSSSGVSFGWLVVDLLSVDALTENCARFRVECELTRQRFSEIVSRVARAPCPGRCTRQQSEVNC